MARRCSPAVADGRARRSGGGPSAAQRRHARAGGDLALAGCRATRGRSREWSRRAPPKAPWSRLSPSAPPRWRGRRRSSRRWPTPCRTTFASRSPRWFAFSICSPKSPRGAPARRAPGCSAKRARAPPASKRWWTPCCGWRGSRAGAGRFAQVDLAPLVARVAARLEPERAALDGRIEHAALPLVQGDEAQLELLFHNLLDNALKFHAAAPPRIRIECAEEAGAWHLRVEDNGVGVPAKDEARIFALFQRLHTASEAPGTGIGLALCRRVVAHHGGRIWVESRPGGGSIFHFTLAHRPQTPGGGSRPRERFAQMTDDRRPTVLMIEDDDADATLIRVLLSRTALDCRVELRERLTLGLERLAQGGVDLVLLDFSLPDSVGTDRFLLGVARPPPRGAGDRPHQPRRRQPRAAGGGGRGPGLSRQAAGRCAAPGTRHSLRHRAPPQRIGAARERATLRPGDAGRQRRHLGLGSRAGARLSLGALAGDGGHRRGGARRPSGELVRLRRRRRLWRNSRPPSRRLPPAATFTSPWSTACAAATARSLWVATRGALVRDGEGQVIRMAGSMSDISARKRRRGATRPRRLPRRAHRPRQPQSLPRSPRHGAHLAAARPQGDLRRAVPRSRPLQDGQRQPRSLGRRPAAGGDRASAREAHAAVRHRRPARRRRVRRPRLRRPRGVRRGPHRRARSPSAWSSRSPIDGQEVHITASIGIALPEAAGASADGLLRDADLAMYRAKAAGPGRYEVFDLELHRASVQLLKLETELRRGGRGAATSSCTTSRSSRSHSGRIAGFEALVRWHHPERGLVPPAHFIAARRGDRTDRPARLAGARARLPPGRAWQERFPADPPCFMSVNVSGKLFAQDGAVETGAARPRGLALAAREPAPRGHRERRPDDGAEVHAPAAHAARLRRAAVDRRLRHRLLVALATCSASATTSSRSTARSCSDIAGADSLAIVETILSLASHLGIGVVAEGIETAEQLAHLRSLGCPHGQGFWFAKPLAPEAAEELLASNAIW